MTLQPWLACTSLCLCVREHKTFVSLRIHAFIHPCVWQWNPHLFSVVFVNTVPGWAAGQTYRLISALGLVYKTTAGRREDCCLHHDNSTSLCLVFKNSRLWYSLYRWAADDTAAILVMYIYGEEKSTVKWKMFPFVKPYKKIGLGSKMCCILFNPKNIGSQFVLKY